MDSSEKTDVATDIFNNSKSDLVDFPGNTLETIDEVVEFSELIK